MKTSERRVGRALMGAAFALVMAGCATTQQAKVTSTPETYCPFLGNDICAKLTATTTPGRFSAGAVGGGEPLTGLRYINPNARWTQYSKVIIAPVSFWGGDDTTVSQADQQALTDYFTKARGPQVLDRSEAAQRRAFEEVPGGRQAGPGRHGGPGRDR